MRTSGATRAYIRGDPLNFNFCSKCGWVTHWLALEPGAEVRRRMAVNLRMTEPEPIAHIPIDHFDGLDKWEHLPGDARCIRDMGC